MNNFDMPTQLDVINFHNTHDTLCVPKGMTLKQLVEDYDRLNNIINELEKIIENRLMAVPDDVLDDGIEEIKRTTKIAVYQVILGDLDKLKELKENKC